MSLDPFLHPPHCMFLGHILRHKTNILSNVINDGSLRVFQLTSSYSIPLTASFTHSFVLLFPLLIPLLITHTLFIHSFPLSIPCTHALIYGYGMCFKSLAGEQMGRWKKNKVRLTWHSQKKGRPAAPWEHWESTEQEVGLRECVG